MWCNDHVDTAAHRRIRAPTLVTALAIRRAMTHVTHAPPTTHTVTTTHAATTPTHVTAVAMGDAPAVAIWDATVHHRITMTTTMVPVLTLTVLTVLFHFG